MVGKQTFFATPKKTPNNCDGKKGGVWKKKKGFDNLVIYWIYPPPRMSVTTRNIQCLVGNPELSLHLWLLLEVDQSFVGWTFFFWQDIFCWVNFCDQEVPHLRWCPILQMPGLRYKVVNQIKHMDALPKLLILGSKANKSGSGFFQKSKVGFFFHPITWCWNIRVFLLMLEDSHSQSFWGPTSFNWILSTGSKSHSIDLKISKGCLLDWVPKRSNKSKISVFFCNLSDLFLVQDFCSREATCRSS